MASSTMLGLDLALVGQRLQRGDGDVVPVDLEEAAQLDPVVAATEAVGAQRDVARSGCRCALDRRRRACNRWTRPPAPHGLPGRFRCSSCGGGCDGCSRFQRSALMPSRRSSLKLVTLQMSAVTLKSSRSSSAAAITSRRIDAATHQLHARPLATRRLSWNRYMPLTMPASAPSGMAGLLIVLVHQGDVVVNVFLLLASCGACRRG